MGAYVFYRKGTAVLIADQLKINGALQDVSADTITYIFKKTIKRI